MNSPDANTLSSVIRLQRPDDVGEWRIAARAYLLAGISPESITWKVGQDSADMFECSLDVPADAQCLVPGNRVNLRVPADFMDLASLVVCHCSPDRFGLLYRILWRRLNGEPNLLTQLADPDIRKIHAYGKQVSRERHKMHAFVRFSQTRDKLPEHFIAWFEPEHHTLRLSIGFFVRRFANMHWSIITPIESAHWDGESLKYGEGGKNKRGASDVSMEALWGVYFSNIFNPSRLKLDAMRSEMPVKYWKNLPEASLIEGLAATANLRSEGMIDQKPSEPPRYADRATAPSASAKNDHESCLDLDE